MISLPYKLKHFVGLPGNNFQLHQCVTPSKNWDVAHRQYRHCKRWNWLKILGHSCFHELFDEQFDWNHTKKHLYISAHGSKYRKILQINVSQKLYNRKHAGCHSPHPPRSRLRTYICLLVADQKWFCDSFMASFKSKGSVSDCVPITI